MKKIALLFAIFAIGLSSVLAQTREITGTVTSADDGNPIPGVSVSVKGTTIGTITDIDGKYNLKVPQDARTLVFSFVGMQTQEVAITGTTLKVVLKSDVVGLNEVVVTALGIKKEAKSLGYAYQEVNSDELSKTGTADMTKALQGKLAGADIKVSSGMPGASSQIVLRGARSFTGNNTPLYVIDGMPIENSFSISTGVGVSTVNGGISGSDKSTRSIDIDPNDIESINILKGQAAAALYGIRASNGVVIITTKSGRGVKKGKPVVTISQTTSFETVSRTPDYQKTYAQGSDGSYVYNTSMSWGPKIEELPDDATYGGNNNGHEGMYYVPQLASAGEDAWVKPQAYNNWDDYFRTGYTSTTSINVSQATDDGNFAVGLGYTDQGGIALNTGMTRWNAKAAAERKLNKNFTTGFSANYANTEIDKLTSANDGSLAGVLSAPPSYNLKGIPYHADGDPYTQVYYRSLNFDNPYWIAKNNTFDEKTDRFFGNGHVDYNAKLAKEMTLNIKYQLGVDEFTTHFQDIWGYGSKGKTGVIDNYGVTQMTYNSLATAVYDWKINPDFDLNVTAGNELNHKNFKFYEEYGEDFNFGGWNHIKNANTVTANEEQSQDRTVGFFYSGSLSWKDMLFFNTTGRNDIVSSMPRNNRSFFYPSVSLGFVASELKELKNISWLDFAKLRASYAEVGQAGNYYQNYYDKPDYSGGFWSGTPISYPLDGVNSYQAYYTQYDPNLKPQNTKSYEFGINLKFLQNRIGIDYTFSRQNVKDQIFSVPLAGSTGESYLVTNGGSVHTNSHEVMLTFVPVTTKDFTWNMSINYSRIRNYVDELAEGVESIYLGGFTTPQVRAGIGDTYPVIYGTQFKKDDLGRILVNEDPTAADYGMPMSGEDGVIGKVAPDFILGLTTDFTYKNFSLGAVFEWKNGGQMYSGDNGLMDLYGVSKRTGDRESTFIYKGYKSDGTPNDIVRGGSNDSGAYQSLYSDVLGNIDEYYIYGNSFIKLRELSLKYLVPKNLIPELDLSVSAFARNILLWTELPNLDPEMSQGNNNMMGSFERFSLPQATSYGFGIEIKF